MKTYLDKPPWIPLSNQSNLFCRARRATNIFHGKEAIVVHQIHTFTTTRESQVCGGGGGVGRRAVGGWLASRWFLDGETALASQSYTQTICRHKISVLRDIDSLENKNSTRTHEHKLSKLHCYRIVRVSFHSVCHTSMFRRHPLTGESGYKRRSTNKVSGNPRAIDR